MLSSNHRLAKEKDFKAVYSSGKKIHSPHLTLVYRPTNQNNSRFGFVVSKKSVSKIVDRNKVKRRMRAQIKNLLSRIDSGYDVVLVGKKGVASLDTQVLRNEIEKNLHKAGIIEKT